MFKIPRQFVEKEICIETGAVIQLILSVYWTNLVCLIVCNIPKMTSRDSFPHHIFSKSTFMQLVPPPYDYLLVITHCGCKLSFAF